MTKTKKQNKKSAKAARANKGGGIKALAENPLVADVVAAALVATAAALKDSRRARALASGVGDELGKLSKAGSQRGNALWDMALEIGKRSVAALGGEGKPAKSGGKKSAKSKAAKASAKKPAANKAAGRTGKKKSGR